MFSHVQLRKKLREEEKNSKLKTIKKNHNRDDQQKPKMERD